MDFYALDESERQGYSSPERKTATNQPTPPAIPSLLPISTAKLKDSTSYVPTLSPIISYESLASADRQNSSASRDPSTVASHPAFPDSSSGQSSKPDTEGDREEWRLSYGPQEQASRLFSSYQPLPVPASQPQTPQPPPHVALAWTQHSPDHHSPASSSPSGDSPHRSLPSPSNPLTQPTGPLFTSRRSPEGYALTADNAAEILRKHQHSWVDVSDTMQDIKTLMLAAATDDSSPTSGGGIPSNVGPERSLPAPPLPPSMEAFLRDAHAHTTHANAGLGMPPPVHANETGNQMVNPRDVSEDAARSLEPAKMSAPSSQLASRAHLQPPEQIMGPRSRSLEEMSRLLDRRSYEQPIITPPRSDTRSSVATHNSGGSSQSDWSSLHARTQRISGNEVDRGAPDRPFVSPFSAPADNAQFETARTFSPSRLSVENNTRGEVSEISSPRQQRTSRTSETSQITSDKDEGHGKVAKWDSLSVHWKMLSKSRQPNAYLCIAAAIPEPILTVFTQGALTWDQHQRTMLGLSLRLSGPPVLPHGDDYSGEWKDGLPSGEGKYMWADGSCYMGSWEDGKPDGPGIYSWASGAFYEGTWKQGCMEGEGTYSDGYIGTFTGSWHDHKMNGFGYIQYTAGDRYEGLLVDGQLEGTGLYTWADGSRYNGMFALGQRDGRGTFVTQANEMFFGEFLEGYEHGRGVYTLPDFSFFDGVWVDGVRHGVGVSFPPPDKDAQVYITAYMHGRKMRAEAASVTFLLTYQLPPMHQSRHAHRVSSSLTKDALLDYLGVRSNSYGKGGMVARNASAPVLRERSLASEVQNFVTSTNEAEQERQNSGGSSAMKCNKMGETVYMGTASYDLMLNLQVGINCVVAQVNREPLRACNAADFQQEDGSGSFFPRLGSESTPPHPSTEFYFKDFCPMVFRNLREKAGISVGDYVQWLCGDAALREMSSPGKSGAGFFISNNDKLLVKTLTKEEFTTLNTLLPKLYHHMMQHPNSMLCQIYGVYRMVLHNGEKVRMMVMRNILSTTAPLHRRFDLKGSTQGRYTKKTLKELKPTSILKDLDLDVMFELPNKWLDLFNEQLHADCMFLESMGLIDYSMLVGIHFRDAKKSPNLVKSLGNKFMVQELDDPFEQYSKITTSLDRLMKLGNNQHSAMPTAMGERSANDEGEVANALNFRPWVQRDRRASMQGVRMAQSKARVDFFSGAGSETSLTTEQLAEARGQSTLLGNAMVATVTPGRVFPCPEDASVTRPPTLKDPHEAVIYFGIIDFLQEYNMRKRLEHQGKAMLYLNKSSISVTNPVAYGTRFRSFMGKLFAAQKEERRGPSQRESLYAGKGVALRDIM